MSEQDNTDAQHEAAGEGSVDDATTTGGAQHDGTGTEGSDASTSGDDAVTDGTTTTDADATDEAEADRDGTAA